MYENCNNILVAAKRDKDNTFLEPYASLISVCVQGLAELIWPQSMCEQVLAKLICESVGIQIVKTSNFRTRFSEFQLQFEDLLFNISA